MTPELKITEPLAREPSLTSNEAPRHVAAVAEVIPIQTAQPRRSDMPTAKRKPMRVKVHPVISRADVPRWIERSLSNALGSLLYDISQADCAFSGRVRVVMPFGFGRAIIDLGNPKAAPVKFISLGRSLPSVPEPKLIRRKAHTGRRRRSA
jgi:hypothetical protein